MAVSRSSSERISPTAYYTGHVWYRNHLSSKAFYSRRGHALFNAVQPIVRVASLFNGGLMPETFILQRHRLIDHLLREAVEKKGIETIVEIAAGMSARGFRFKEEFGSRIEYIEGDLPEMAARKRRVLGKAGLPAEEQKVMSLDVMEDSGPLSMEETIGPLLGSGSVAIITEGLLNYFPRDAVVKMWRRFAALIGSSGVYLTDLHVESATPTDFFARAWRGVIGLFTGGETYLDFKDRADAEASLKDAGFTCARLHDPYDYVDAAGMPDCGGRRVVHVLEGSIGLG